MPPAESKEEGKSSESIVIQVTKYFFDDASFSDAFERWTEDHAHLIDAEAEEYELKYTELYTDFKAKYETLLEAFIVRQGSTVSEFYDELRAAQEKDPEGSEALMGEIMLATTDFDIFMAMMKDVRRTQDRSGSHK
ncbi:hypothetical protein M885DRAFT_533692 [Pelagophyceae sp. CCMP2097]|nr:hypothetical protein M885DRAFT_533692 [Pelagophyceae sp. CCMP2097]